MTVRFGDGDPAGVIFYPRAIELAHAAVEDFIRHSTIGWEAWFASPTHAFPVRRVEAEFLRAMKPGETYAVATHAERVGNTSVTFVAEFADRSGQKAARVCSVHVMTERSSGEPATIPEEIRKALD